MPIFEAKDPSNHPLAVTLNLPGHKAVTYNFTDSSPQTTVSDGTALGLKKCKWLRRHSLLKEV